MPNPLLRVHKDELATKLHLALFTQDPADNLELAARVAHLEAELAGVSLAFHRHDDAMTSLVSAASAYRQLGELAKARSCLEQAALLPAGDSELHALLDEALKDLRAKLHPEKRPAKAPKAEEKPAPKKAEKSAEKAAEKAEKPAEPEKVEAEKPAEPEKAEEKPAPKKKAPRKKKAEKKED